MFHLLQDEIQRFAWWNNMIVLDILSNTRWCFFLECAMCITLFWIRVQLVVLDHHVVFRCLDHLGNLHLRLALAWSTRFQHDNKKAVIHYVLFVR